MEIQQVKTVNSVSYTEAVKGAQGKGETNKATQKSASEVAQE